MLVKVNIAKEYVENKLVEAHDHKKMLLMRVAEIDGEIAALEAIRARLVGKGGEMVEGQVSEEYAHGE